MQEKRSNTEEEDSEMAAKENKMEEHTSGMFIM